MPLQKTTPQEIIQKSIAIFRKRGYYRTNMSDLAKATGLTKGAFYHHFANKEEVMRRALDSTIWYFEKHIFSIAYNDHLSDHDKLLEMSNYAYRAFSDGEGGCFFANTILETAHVEDTFLVEIRRFFDQWEAALKKVFEKHYEGEKLQDVVHQIIGDIEGSIILMQLHKDPIYLRRAMLRGFEKF